MSVIWNLDILETLINKLHSHKNWSLCRRGPWESSTKLYVICRMILRVHLLVYSPSLLGDMNFGEEALSLHHTIRQLFTRPTAWFRNSFPASATHSLLNTT